MANNELEVGRVPALPISKTTGLQSALDGKAAVGSGATAWSSGEFSLSYNNNAGGNYSHMAVTPDGTKLVVVTTDNTYSPGYRLGVYDANTLALLGMSDQISSGRYPQGSGPLVSLVVNDTYAWVGGQGSSPSTSAILVARHTLSSPGTRNEYYGGNGSDVQLAIDLVNGAVYYQYTNQLGTNISKLGKINASTNALVGSEIQIAASYPSVACGLVVQGGYVWAYHNNGGVATVARLTATAVGTSPAIDLPYTDGGGRTIMVGKCWPLSTTHLLLSFNDAGIQKLMTFNISSGAFTTVVVPNNGVHAENNRPQAPVPGNPTKFALTSGNGLRPALMTVALAGDTGTVTVKESTISAETGTVFFGVVASATEVFVAHQKAKNVPGSWFRLTI